jgi:hypothetical protein
MKYEFNFIFDENGYKQLRKEKSELRKKLKKNKTTQKNSITVLIELLASIIVFYCLSGFDLNKTSLYVILLIIMFFLLYRLGRKNKTYFLKKQNYINGNHHLIVSEKFIKRELENCSIEYKWVLIKDVVITSNYIFVITFQDKIMFVPRNVFKDYIELKKFYRFVKENIDNLSYENLIEDYVKKMGGITSSIKRSRDDNGPFFEESKDKIIYKFEYEIKDEIKEGWVKFDNIHNGYWRI